MQRLMPNLIGAFRFSPHRAESTAVIPAKAGIQSFTRASAEEKFFVSIMEEVYG